MNKEHLAIAKDVAEKVRRRLLPSYRNHCTNSVRPDVVRLGPDEYDAVTAICAAHGIRPTVCGLPIQRIKRPGVRVGCAKKVDTGWKAKH